MFDISYSVDALNARSAFFGVKVVIYVEGDDDVLFWKEVFSKVADERFEIESVGGAPILDEYIGRIESGELQAIAARDADFLPVIGSLCGSPRVLYTKGYSIENSLYVSTSLAQIVRLWCKSPRISEGECSEWLNKLASTLEPLIRLDAANAMAGTGVPTIGDNCGRYMKSPSSADACPVRVAAAVREISERISSDAAEAVNKGVGIDPDDVILHLRGHFLASAVHRYIVKNAKSFGKKVSISAESLYAVAINQFISAIGTDHPHRAHYLDSARIAWLAL